jgi:manganese oxidase
MHYYRSAVGGPAHMYAGLLGPLIVTRRGEADEDGRPVGVENEIVTVLWVADEAASPYWESENQGRGDGEAEPDETLYHTINGYVYCSLDKLRMQLGKRTRWYGGAIGNEVDVHSLHVHGNIAVTTGGQHGDSFRLLPYSSIAVDYRPENSGTFLFHCHVAHHMASVRPVPQSRTWSEQILSANCRPQQTLQLQSGLARN